MRKIITLLSMTVFLCFGNTLEAQILRDAWKELKKAVTIDDGKNCVGQLKLGTTINNIPDRIKGMYSDVFVEDTYYNGRSRRRVSFRSDGVEVMYGISDWSGNNSKLDLLVIDDGVNITEVKYQK